MRDPKDAAVGVDDTEQGLGTPRREAARTTIVGGQPDGNARDLPPIPVGLEHLMGLAAASPEFAEALERDRQAALRATGLELSASERAILSVVPSPALSQMISRVEGKLDAPDRRRFFEQAAIALAALVGAATSVSASGCSKKEPSQSEKQGSSPDKDQPGAPEADREPAREPEAREPPRDAAAPQTPRPEAAVTRPAEPEPGRPAGQDGMGTDGMDADAMDMASMVPAERTAPARIAPDRIRPDQPPPTKGIQPWRPRPRPTEPAKTRGISPDRDFGKNGF